MPEETLDFFMNHTTTDDRPDNTPPQSPPEALKHVTVQGRDVYLLGTAHVSKESVQDVRRSVAALAPDTICVELCHTRHRAIVDRESWRKMDIVRVIRQKKAVFLLAQLVMSSFYRKIAQKLGVEPGAEMIEGIRQAERTGAELVLADREIEITLKRTWRSLGFIEKLKLFGQMFMGLFFMGDVDDEFIESIKHKDQMEVLLEAFSGSFPEVKRRLIDERDIYLAQKIRSAPGQKVLAIVGAGHLEGIEANLHQDIPLAPLRELPPKSNVGAVFKWGIPAVIVALIAMGFIRGGSQQSVESIVIWVGMNGLLSGIGAALALAHPLTILAAILAAPFTSLNPMIAAGFVAGLVQAMVRKPTVADLEDLPRAIGSFKGFWTNPVCRILLVVVLVNLGSSLATFISGSWIAVRTF